MIVNDNLTWEDHIVLVKAKVCKNIGVIQKIRNNLSKNILQLLYYTLIHPYFNYCNIIWACQDNVHTQTLYRLQKKVIRLVTLAPWDSHSAPIFRRLNILNIFDINKLQVGCFVYKYLTGLLHFSFAYYFIRKSSIHMIDIRTIPYDYSLFLMIYIF